MRQGDSVYYIVADHLGTTHLVLDAQGNKVAESRHLPYGEVRWSDGTLPTDYRFTGERHQPGLGLYRMGARFYDHYLNRFLSPDSIVPDLSNPQNLNRYSYVDNRPLNAVDPTGHYGREVHEKLTYDQTFEAVKAKVASYELTADQAKRVEEFVAGQVAAGNQGTDCMVCADSSASPTGRMHWLTKQEAEGRAQWAVSTTWANKGRPGAFILRDFGRVMHGIQDYYSHRGQGYTYAKGLGGMGQYLTGVLFGGETFDPKTFANSTQFGHSGISFNTRGSFLGIPLTAFGGGTWPASLDPDDYNSLDPTDAWMTVNSQKWIELYISVYLDWVWGLSEDELWCWDQATQDTWHLLHDADASQ